jgi:serine/threonine protein kinase
MFIEFCNGGDLGKLLKARGRFTETESRFIMSQIVNGYSSLHKLNAIHRDLKLDNIFLHFKKMYIEDVFKDKAKFEYFKKTANLSNNVDVIIGDLGFARKLEKN